MRRKILRLLLTATLATPLFIMSSTPAMAVAYLTVNGNQFQYGAQSVGLRGTDFKNVNAWDAMIGNGDMGSLVTNQTDYNVAGTIGGGGQTAKNANVVRFSIAWSWWANQFNVDGTCTVTPGCYFFTILDQHVAWVKAAHMWMVLTLTTVPERTQDMNCSQPPPTGNCVNPEPAYGGPSPYVWTPYGCYAGHAANTGQPAPNVCPFWYENCAQCEQDQVNNFWQQVATHYANEPTIAGYEILNLPQAPTAPYGGRSDMPTQWSDFATRVYNTITAADPNHFVLVEANLDFHTPIIAGATKEVLAQHEHPSCSSDGFIDTVPSPEYDGTRPLWIDEFSENKSRCTNGDASWTSGRISAYNSAGYHWTHSNWRQPDIGTWQNNVAADFTQPWTQMQNAVFPNWSGLVHPT